jgi:hypothetical protein
MATTGECRCCRKPIDRSRLACPPHWSMLPKPLRDAILDTYNTGPMKAYCANVGEADKIWKAAGLWRQGVPVSTRAAKGVAALKALL